MPEEADASTPAPPTPPSDAMLPWWKRGMPAIVITGIISGTVAISQVGVQLLKQQHEEAMEDQKLRHLIQMDYLDRLKNDSERLRTLRLVTETSDDKKFGAWATKETDIVMHDTDRLQKAIDAAKATGKPEEIQAALARLVDTQSAELASQRQRIAELEARCAPAQPVQPQPGNALGLIGVPLGAPDDCASLDLQCQTNLSSPACSLRALRGCPSSALITR